MIQNIPSGVAHELSIDLKEALNSNPQALALWKNISALARNEWICWIESAKKAETRKQRIDLCCKNLAIGKQRPCCWPGCSHRY